MKIIKFDASKKICADIFRHNEVIHEIYFEIANIVLVRLYKAFPFNSLFEGFKWENMPNESFQSTMIVWADCFMLHHVDDIDMANIAIDELIDRNIIPGLGLFLAAYKSDYETLKMAEYHAYIDYVYSLSKYKNKVLVSDDVMVFGEWLHKNRI